MNAPVCPALPDLSTLSDTAARLRELLGTLADLDERAGATRLPCGAVLLGTVNGPPVLLDADVYEDLTPEQRRPRWSLNSLGYSYALVRAGAGTRALARIAAGAGDGGRVRYLNGDPSDLRRANLYRAPRDTHA
jgi:hypothetical protein